LTHFGGGYDSDGDDDVIEGESREVGDDHGGQRRISWKKFLLLGLVLAGAILLLLAAFNSCGGGDSQSTGDTDSPTVVPTEVATTPEPTASTAASTPTATSTSAVTVPTATVRADTGDPLGLTDGSSGSGGIVMFVLALLVATSCVWIFFRKTGSTA